MNSYTLDDFRDLNPTVTMDTVREGPAAAFITAKTDILAPNGELVHMETLSIGDRDRAFDSLERVLRSFGLVDSEYVRVY